MSVDAEKFVLGEWGEQLLIRSDGRHCLKGCNGDEVQLEPEQWLTVASRLTGNRWAAFTDDELEALSDLLMSGSYGEEDAPPMAGEVLAELRRRA